MRKYYFENDRLIVEISSKSLDENSIEVDRFDRLNLNTRDAVKIISMFDDVPQEILTNLNSKCFP